MNITLKRFAGGAVAAAALLLLAGPALADGMRSRAAAPKAAEPRCKLSANVALTTEYVFRGFSQTAENPAIQGGFDATCGIFYAGLWASNLDWGGDLLGNDIANIEIDYYLGIKPVTGKITWDLGIIYYSYPGSADLFVGRDNNYLELKVGGSAEIWKDGTFGVTVFYSPEYQYETNGVWTIETSFAQVLPKIGIFTPTFSALLGYQSGDSTYQAIFLGGLEDKYLYWNAGVTFGFADKWSLDFRYWDTDLPSALCKNQTFQCDERFVGTLKFTY
jgi:uncharacterized protein (TIGR02001 family)